MLSSCLFQGRTMLALFLVVDCLSMVANHQRLKTLLAIGASLTLGLASGSKLKSLSIVKITITNRCHHSS